MAATDKDVPVVSVAEAAIIVQALDLFEASLKRRMNSERNAGIKQLIANDAHAVLTLRRKFSV